MFSKLLTFIFTTLAYSEINYYCGLYNNDSCYLSYYLNDILINIPVIDVDTNIATDIDKNIYRENNFSFKQMPFIILFYSDLNHENVIMPELLNDEYITEYVTEYVTDYITENLNENVKNYTEILHDIFTEEDYCFNNNSWLVKNNETIDIFNNYILKDFFNYTTKNEYCINTSNKYYIQLKKFYTNILNLFDNYIKNYIKDLISVVITFITGLSLGIFIVGNSLYYRMKTNKDYLYQEDTEQDEIDFYKYKYIEEYDRLENIDIINIKSKFIKGEFIEEVTPKGTIYMSYDNDNQTFIYYAKSASSIPYNYLDTVARKYVIFYNCKNIYYHMHDEMIKDFNIMKDKIENREKENKEKENKEKEDKEKEKQHNNDEKDIKNVFINVKTYNKTYNENKLDKKCNKFKFIGTFNDCEKNKEIIIKVKDIEEIEVEKIEELVDVNVEVEKIELEKIEELVDVKVEVEDVKVEDVKVENEIIEEEEENLEEESVSDSKEETINDSKEEETISSSKDDFEIIDNNKQKKKNRKLVRKDSMNRLVTKTSITFKDFKKTFISDKKNN